MLVSVTEADAYGFGCADKFSTHRYACIAFGHLVDRDSDDLIAAECDHAVGLTAKECLCCRYAEACCQYAVICRRRAAALEMTECGAACFCTAELFELFGKDVADTTETELLCAARIAFYADHFAADRCCTFCYDNKAELAAFFGTARDLLLYGTDVVRDLGDKDTVRTARKARVECDPTCIAAHDFEHHDAMMRFCCGVESVECFG